MSHSAEKIREHPFNVSESLGYRKNLGIIGGIKILRRKFFVSQCRKNSWASLQCFRKVGVSKICMHNRGIPIFRRNFFVSVPKNFLGEPYCAVSENFRSRKSLLIRGGGGVSRWVVARGSETDCGLEKLEYWRPNSL